MAQFFCENKFKIMKIFRVLFLLVVAQLIFGFTTSLMAQKLKTDDVPGDVTQSFQSEYPNAKLSFWSLEDNQYIATFKDDGSEGKAYFSNDGTWKKTTYAIPVNELPLSISQYVTTNYPYYEVSVCFLQEMPKVSTHYYLQVRYPEVGSKDKPSELTFDYIGNLIKREDPPGFVLRTDEPAQPTTDKTAPSKPARVEVVKNDKPAKAEKEVTDEKPAKPEKVEAAPAPKPEKPKKGKKEETAPFDPWAQYAIGEKDVPSTVMKAFKKKAPKPVNAKWFLVGETYVLKCEKSDLPLEVFVSKKAALKKTYTYMLEERLNMKIRQFLEEHYKGYKFIKAFKEERADKQNKIYVEFYEKKNWKKKIPTGAWFDAKKFSLIRTVDPNFEDALSDPDLFVNNAPSAEDIEAAIAQLPEGIKSYVASNYPAHHIRDYEMEEDKDLGEIYRVEIISTGTSYINLFFDKSGKFLRKELSDGMKTVKSYGDYDEIQVPEVVIKAFNTSFPRVENPVWDEDENENFDVQFIGTKGKEMCIFSPEGQLLEDLFFLDEGKVMPEIESYLKDNVGKYEIQNYFSVKKGNKNYYKIVVLPNKSKYPKYFWFNANGSFDHEEN